MRAVVLALAALLAAPAAAHAGEVGRVGLGEQITDLLTDPAGGAWTTSWREVETTIVARHDAGRPTRRAELRGLQERATLGPDGTAWLAARTRLHRFDREGRSSYAAELPYGELGFRAGMVTVPDGTLWTLPEGETSRLARITARGVIAFSPFPAAPCRRFGPADMTRASDGAIWIADDGCDRLVRIAPDGTTSVVPAPEGSNKLTPDAAGGVWFVAFRGLVGHSGGARHEIENAQDVAVAPDGTVWVADGTCVLKRIGGGSAAAPAPAYHLATGPSGLWVASTTRVFEGLGGGPCDDRPPTAKLRRPKTLAALARGGLRVTVREPVALELYLDGPEFAFGTIMRAPGTWRLKPSRAVVRALANRRTVHFILRVTDADGNTGEVEGQLRLTRR